jgi:hypothetical protein
MRFFLLLCVCVCVYSTTDSVRHRREDRSTHNPQPYHTMHALASSPSFLTTVTPPNHTHTHTHKQTYTTIQSQNALSVLTRASQARLQLLKHSHSHNNNNHDATATATAGTDIDALLLSSFASMSLLPPSSSSSPAVTPQEAVAALAGELGEGAW